MPILRMLDVGPEARSSNAATLSAPPVGSGRLIRATLVPVLYAFLALDATTRRQGHLLAAALVEAEPLAVNAPLHMVKATRYRTTHDVSPIGVYALSHTSVVRPAPKDLERCAERPRAAFRERGRLESAQEPWCLRRQPVEASPPHGRRQASHLPGATHADVDEVGSVFAARQELQTSSADQAAAPLGVVLLRSCLLEPTGVSLEIASEVTFREGFSTFATAVVAEDPIPELQLAAEVHVPHIANGHSEPWGQPRSIIATWGAPLENRRPPSQRAFQGEGHVVQLEVVRDADVVPWCAREEAGKVVLLRAVPRHVFGVYGRGDLCPHLIERSFARLQQDHSGVDAPSLAPRPIWIVLTGEEPSAVNWGPMRVVVAASEKRGGGLQLEKVVEPMQRDEVDVQEQNLGVFGGGPSLELREDAVEACAPA
mmetsp:Transcript_20702/g.57816  ORF Transcript_20702/g.57816 Transcript_20702/m.57816 type:complete len:427 (+) Transcript_20702:73-1353(+)